MQPRSHTSLNPPLRSCLGVFTEPAWPPVTPTASGFTLELASTWRRASSTCQLLFTSYCWRTKCVQTQSECAPLVLGTFGSLFWWRWGAEKVIFIFSAATGLGQNLNIQMKSSLKSVLSLWVSNEDSFPPACLTAPHCFFFVVTYAEFLCKWHPGCSDYNQLISISRPHLLSCISYTGWCGNIFRVCCMMDS